MIAPVASSTPLHRPDALEQWATLFAGNLRDPDGRSRGHESDRAAKAAVTRVGRNASDTSRTRDIADEQIEAAQIRLGRHDVGDPRSVWRPVDVADDVRIVRTDDPCVRPIGVHDDHFRLIERDRRDECDSGPIRTPLHRAEPEDVRIGELRNER